MMDNWSRYELQLDPVIQNTKVKFEDVAGNEEAKEELKEKK